MHERQLVGHERPGGRVAGRGDVRHAAVLCRQLLRDGRQVVESNMTTGASGTMPAAISSGVYTAGPAISPTGNSSVENSIRSNGAPVAMTTCLCSKARISPAPSTLPGYRLTFCSLAKLPEPPVDHAPPGGQPGKPAFEFEPAPAQFVAGSASYPVAAAAKSDRTVEPAAATTSRYRWPPTGGANTSGCQLRRHSSPAVEFGGHQGTWLVSSKTDAFSFPRTPGSGSRPSSILERLAHEGLAPHQVFRS